MYPKNEARPLRTGPMDRAEGGSYAEFKVYPRQNECRGSEIIVVFEFNTMA